MPPSKRLSHLEKYHNGQQQDQSTNQASNGYAPRRHSNHEHRPSTVRPYSSQLNSSIQRQPQNLQPHQLQPGDQRQHSAANRASHNMQSGTNPPNNTMPTNMQQSLNRGTQRPTTVHPASATSRPASHSDTQQIRIFDLFFDLPHPGASKSAERPKMIEPPEVSNQALLSELYDSSAFSRLARFAFPDFSDQQCALDQQASSASRPRYLRINMGLAPGILNKRDVYLVQYRSERHTFVLELRDRETKLYGHVLHYLPRHESAKSRSDVGRRGLRALVLLTRAPGGDGFYTAVLKSLESVIVHGDSLAHFSVAEDTARVKVTRFLHGLHRLQMLKYSEGIFKLNQSQQELTQNEQMIEFAGIEIDVKRGSFVDSHSLPGDCIKLELPRSLQAGFHPSAIPDDYDAPVLPLLRCIGATNTIRILTALLCERKVVFVSDNVTRLSTCVRAASSMLAQGQLTWRFNMVPILSPRLLNCLSVDEPYLIGVLDDFMANAEQLRNLSDVLCIHLDKNQFKLFGFETQSNAIPDILAKSGKETAFQILHSDMQEVIKAETRTWGVVDYVVDVSEPITRKKKNSKQEKVDVDIAALFNRVMRGDALTSTNEVESVDSSLLSDWECSRLDSTSGHLPRVSERQRLETGILKTFDVCENIRCEEGLRASLTYFFLSLYGDLGAMLSQGSNGVFFLDRKKYLLHQVKQGIKESSPLFSFLKAFSGTAMLEHHLNLRIYELQNGKSNVLPSHRSLFSLCEKHLRMKKLAFNNIEIRNVVSQTIVHYPMHALVEKSELARARALALTSAQLLDDNVAEGLGSLLQDCHKCDTVLPQVIAVIWSRLDERKQNSWKQPLLALYLLKSLLLEGPITVVSYALDRIERIRRMRFYDISKSDENNNEVRKMAKIVWELLTDGPSLFLQRKIVFAQRARLFFPNVNNRWGNTRLKQLPFETDFQRYHALLCPYSSRVGPRMELGRLRMSLKPVEGVPISFAPGDAAAELCRLKNSSTHSSQVLTGRNSLGPGHNLHSKGWPNAGPDRNSSSHSVDYEPRSTSRNRPDSNAQPKVLPNAARNHSFSSNGQEIAMRRMSSSTKTQGSPDIEALSGRRTQGLGAGRTRSNSLGVDRRASSSAQQFQGSLRHDLKIGATPQPRSNDAIIPVSADRGPARRGSSVHHVERLKSAGPQGRENNANLTSFSGHELEKGASAANASGPRRNREPLPMLGPQNPKKSYEAHHRGSTPAHLKGSFK